jgi:hypothetical protein
VHPLDKTLFGGGWLQAQGKRFSAFQVDWSRAEDKHERPVHSFASMANRLLVFGSLSCSHFIIEQHCVRLLSSFLLPNFQPV